VPSEGEVRASSQHDGMEGKNGALRKTWCLLRREASVNPNGTCLEIEVKIDYEKNLEQVGRDRGHHLPFIGNHLRVFVGGPTATAPRASVGEN
jgi:hypothetical protein